MGVKATRIIGLLRYAHIEGEKITAKDRLPGTFEWAVNGEGKLCSIIFTCPCGCGDLSAIAVTGTRAWAWDGNVERPTLNPSVKRTTGCKWHGWLRDGVWVK